MTTRTLDRRDRSKQITLLTSITAGVAVAAVVAFTAFGGGGVGDDDGTVVPPAPSARPSAPAETPAESPAATPGPDEIPTRTPLPDDSGSDAMPIKVDLANATGADVYVDIADETGSPGDGMSVDASTLKVENLDASTLKLTWVDFLMDNALALYIMDDPDGAIRLVMVQPEPTGPADAMGFDRELILSSRSRSRRTRSWRSSRTAWTRPAEGPTPGTQPPAFAGAGLASLGRRDEMRQERRPAAAIPIAPRLPLRAERLPAPMLDLHARRRVTAIDELDLHLGGVVPVAPQVPQVPEAGRRFPDRHLAPLMLGAGHGPLKDPAAGARLQHDRGVRLARRGVICRPPSVDARGPHLEGVVGRAVDLEGEPDRLDHRDRRGPVVFEASSENRAAASPQTCSR